MAENEGITTVDMTNVNYINKSEEKENNNQNMKLKFCNVLIAACVFIGLVILVVAVILIIGYFKGWFNQKEENIIKPRREEYSVSRYLEIKNSTNSYFFESESENENKKTQNYTIITDFIVAIKTRNVINNFNKIDYFYESFLLIINITELNETDSVSLGGIDIYDDSKSIDDLINNNEDLFKNISLDNNNQTKVNKTQVNIPFAQFYFYENGTIDKINFPQDINEFYKSAINDLIDKVTPNITESIYRSQENRRRLNQKNEIFNIIKDNKLDKIIIYEENLQKNINKNEDGEGNEVNSIIKRTFNASGDLILVEMEGEAIFRNEFSKSKKDINLRLNEEGEVKRTERHEEFTNLGLNELKINVTSKMKLSDRRISPLLLLNLTNLSKKLNIAVNDEPKSGYYTTRIKDIEVEISNKSCIKNKSNEDYSDKPYYLDECKGDEISSRVYNISDIENTSISQNTQIENINYKSSYISKYTAVSLNFLGSNISLQQNLYINKNTGLRQNYISLIIDNKEYNISKIDMYQYYYSGSQSFSKKILEKSLGSIGKKIEIFGFKIKSSFSLNLEISHGISIDVINGEMYTKSIASYNLGVSATFGPEFKIFSCGVELKGQIAQGDSYIQANTLLNINSKNTKFIYSRALSSCRIDLEFYLSVSLKFWENKLKKSINLYKGVPSYSSFYEYV